ncbi:MAG: GFA family protein [Woeseiaceae bacterium]
MPGEHIRIDGACHCRNIRFVLSWPETGADVPVRICSCSFCQKRAGSWTSHPGAELAAEIGDLARVSKYRFGTKTADFYVCANCGVVPFVTSMIDGDLYAVVNVLSFENSDALPLVHSSTDFDAEDSESRLDRRKHNWIPNVQISLIGS